MATATQGAPSVGLSRGRRNLVFSAVLLAMGLASLDQTIVATALPTIVDDLGSAGHMSWVVTSYMIAMAVSVALAGKFGDQYGRDRIFQAAAAIFVIGSMLCGLAEGMVWLIAWRAVQGLGAGALMVTATAVIGDIVPLRERGKYQGAVGAVFGLSAVLGPLLGGFFTDQLSWRWAFYVNVPLAALVIVVAATVVPGRPARARPVIDYAGIVLLGAGATALTLATSWGGSQYPWDSPVILGLAASSLAAFAGFVLVERRAREPMLPLRLFRGQVFTVSVVLSAIVGFAMLGTLTYLPAYLQYVKGISPTLSGVAMLPMVAGLLAASVSSGTLVGRTGQYKIFPVLGTPVMGLGLLLMSRWDADTGTWERSAAMVVLGVGIGLCMQVLTIVVQNTTPYQDLGVATSGVTFFRTMGSSFGAAVFGTIYLNHLTPRLAGVLAADPAIDPAVAASPTGVRTLPADQQAEVLGAYVTAFQHVFRYAVPVAVVGFGLALLLKQVPMQDSARAGAADVGDGFAVPTEDDHERALDRQVAVLLRRHGRHAAAPVLAASGARLDLAAARALLEVRMHERVRGMVDRAAVAAALRADRHDFPAGDRDVASTLDGLVDTGYLTGDDGRLALTAAGAREVALVTGSWRRWLAARLAADHLPDQGPAFEAALDRLAHRVVADEPAPRR